MLQSIRSLRGVAALLVVIYHACEYARTHGHADMANTFLFGAFGVDLFFVISGYVMLLALEKIITSPQSASHLTIDFLARRLIRIAPIYWIGTVFLYTIYAIQPEKFKAFSATFEMFARSMLFLPIDRGAGKSTISPILSQGWTLYHEFFFYAVLSTLLAFNIRQKLKYATPALVAAITILGCILITDTRQPWIELITSPINMEFSLGCIVYTLRRPKGSALALITAASSCAVAMVFLQLAPELSKVRDATRTIYWGMPAALIFYAAICLERQIALFSDKFNKFAGDPSYSIYIFHGLIFSGLDIFIKKTGINGNSTAFVAMLTLGAAVISNFIYRAIEMPLTRKLNSIWSLEFNVRPAR
ncbi:MAG: acyltransferase [Aquabacterium sp.]|uniref:acyltransferase family protein n=1 Tax=Aquabacterium sp. TaxID=1872578 RepID=UPI0012291231|nr:acyltransferase [Aquabacterium sp.]TAK85112.1 MAG: acyltransferase [Aquabacterium sp.]